MFLALLELLDRARRSPEAACYTKIHVQSECTSVLTRHPVEGSERFKAEVEAFELRQFLEASQKALWPVISARYYGNGRNGEMLISASNIV